MSRRLGDVEEQVLGQLIRGGLVDAVCTLFDETLELLVDLAQQGTNRGSMGDPTTGQPFDHARCNLPQRTKWCVLAEYLQACEHPRHIAQVSRQILITNDPDQRNLKHLSHLAQQHWQIGGLPLRKILTRKRRTTG